MVLLRGRELIHNAFGNKIFSWPSTKSGESDKSGQSDQSNKPRQLELSSDHYEYITSQ